MTCENNCVLGHILKWRETLSGNMRDSSTWTFTKQIESMTPCPECNPTGESVKTFWRVERIERALEYHNLKLRNHYGV